ncbi:MAG: amidohydrolase family protein [Acidobacteriota bacterium]|nr:amidohydrolase family protein [Acidobacteriota bacterium]
MRPYLAQIKSNLQLMGRDRTVLFFSFLFPLTFFFLFAQLFHGGQSPAAMAQVVSMVMIFGVLGAGFFGAGMRTVQDRETNVLRRFKVAPITPLPVIVASLVAGLVSFIPTVFLFFFLARIVYHMPVPANFWSLLLFICIGVVTFRAMGMIVAAVVNSAQEAQIVIQILYLPMLFLSGATFPVAIMPIWVQTVANFLPATYLFQGMNSMMIGGEGIAANWSSILALLVTMAVALFVGVKLFRWEKEEIIAGKAKLWILVVLAPFLILGVIQASTKQNIGKQKILMRQASRNRSILFQNARIFIGDGNVIEHGAVLIKGGKIAQVFQNPPKDTKSFNADVWDEAGRTLMPGLIDMHVHIGAPGGVYKDSSKYMQPNADERRIAAYLYCGITAVRSTGDWLDNSIKLRQEINSGEYLGAELFSYGPLFTAPDGHPTELLGSFPDAFKKTAEAQFVRLSKSQDEARRQVDELKKAGVDGIKAVLESGNASWGTFNRLDTKIYDAVISEAQKNNLPTATHTGSAADVKDAIDAGTNTIEHGSTKDAIPAALFSEMKRKGIAYDPTLSVFIAVTDMRTGNSEPLDRSLVQRVAPSDLIADTRAMLQRQKALKPEYFKPFLDRLNQNLMLAYKSGVPLIIGSDAGNMLVIHGPTVQRELELWVKAGIPASVALQSATHTAAKYLRAENRIGLIAPGHDASLILLDGDPVQDITATERISDVFFRGEQVSRWNLLDQDKK